jgi:hypothetical protein
MGAEAPRDGGGDGAAPVAPVIQGIGAILTDGEGKVVAHAFDFERSGFGGFTLWEAQRIRVRGALARTFIAHWCFGDVASVIDQHESEKIVAELCRKKNYHLKFIDIGHGVQDDLDRQG